MFSRVVKCWMVNNYLSYLMSLIESVSSILHHFYMVIFQLLICLKWSSKIDSYHDLIVFGPYVFGRFLCILALNIIPNFLTPSSNTNLITISYEYHNHQNAKYKVAAILMWSVIVVDCRVLQLVDDRLWCNGLIFYPFLMYFILFLSIFGTW